MGNGLKRVAKPCGGITINGKKFNWDYHNDEAVSEAQMPHGSERHVLSERARWLKEPKGQKCGYGMECLPGCKLAEGGQCAREEKFP